MSDVKITLTPEEKIQLFMHYPNAHFDFIRETMNYKNLQNSGYDPRVGILGFDSRNVFVPYKHYNPEHCFLKLKPIESISKEDAEQVIKITATYCREGNEITMVLQLFKDYWMSSRCNVYPADIIKCGDYLRLRDYNVGSGKYTAGELANSDAVIIIPVSEDGK